MKFVEIMPVEDVFVTALGEIEGTDGNLLRFYLYARERGVYALKARLLVPVSHAIVMNTKAAKVLIAEHQRANPLQAVN
jgi:hypothetical protein